MKFLLQFLFALFLWLLGAVAGVAGDDVSAGVSWQLLPDARVGTAGIFLNQIVKTAPPVVLPQLRLAPAPPAGQTVSFTRAQILDLAQNSLTNFSLTNWTGAQRIKVTRRTRNLEEEELTTLLTKAIQSNYVKEMGELELRFSTAWTPLLVPDEELTVRITDVPVAGLNPSFQAGFEIWNRTERLGRFQAVLLAKIWKEIPVAHSRLERGQLLRDADVTMERRDVLAVHDVAWSIAADNDSLALTEPIAVGMPIPNRVVHPRAVIKRGQTVDGIYTQGALRISLKVTSMEDGALGQTVRVINPKTRRELYGKVQNDETININL
jgi:flagellar basal body P-ring formation protein FlgA